MPLLSVSHCVVSQRYIIVGSFNDFIRLFNTTEGQHSSRVVGESEGEPGRQGVPVWCEDIKAFSSLSSKLEDAIKGF